MRKRLFLSIGIGVALAGALGCGGGGNGSGPDSGSGLLPGDSGSGPDGGALTSPQGLSCSDLFQQDTLLTYGIDISADEWNKMVAEFNDLPDLLTGKPFVVYHPVTFHMGTETVPDAAVKLHGQSSWLQAVMFDGARAKMQFDVSFNQMDPNAKFHGLSKLVFDMPRSDWTFLHDRLSHAWLREAGILAPCTSSGRLEINGSFYGLYAVEESVGQHVVQEFFPGNSAGDLWKGGLVPETNSAMPNWNRQKAFWAAGDLGALSAIVDLKSSLTSWAAEALLNDADGFYGGFHNFYIYDQGDKGFVYLPQDTDSTFEWLAQFDLPGFDDHPIFFWQARAAPAPLPGPHWMITLGDPTWRKRYADAIAALLARWDVGQLQGWIDTWSAQIAGEVSADPHAWATPANFQRAVATARDGVAKRAEYLQSFVACENGDGDDKDGDGARWCDDCRDDDPTIHLGAPELCNGVDDNCNGAVDEGCQ